MPKSNNSRSDSIESIRTYLVGAKGVDPNIVQKNMGILLAYANLGCDQIEFDPEINRLRLHLLHDSPKDEEDKT